jgi:hypothetical protein
MRFSRASTRVFGVGSCVIAMGLVDSRSRRIAKTEIGGMRVRRANTRITPIDQIVVQYEQRLRETASLEKVFKYFSSIVVHGRGELCLEDGTMIKRPD